MTSSQTHLRQHRAIPAIVTTRKIDAGRYAVIVDGRETRLIIEKGDPPKFGMTAGWDIRVDGYDMPIAWDLKGKHGAVAAIATIINST